MKNIINYYYNFNIYDFHQNNDDYYFKNKDKSYILKRYYKDIDTIDNYLFINNISSYYHKIILTKYNYSYINMSDKVYVLLELSNIYNDTISIYDLNNISVSFNYPLNWYKLWCDRIDYFEYEMEHNKNKDILLLPIYNFMIGISENAISYYRNILDKYQFNNKLFISHHRTDSNMNLIDFYNPLETVIDIKERDIGEYIKSLIFNNNLDISLIDEYLSNINIDTYSASLIFSRVLFPSNLFDMYLDSKFMLNFNIDLYISKIKLVYYLLRNKYNIEEIYWLK